ncbi:MAG: carboxypeptidase regulatory-like domain-containing protein [Planctomycetes bacterium]|nr:carboxypeptidase regulatory-like domain-containing protein [Planctomycetota bacterium]
MIGASLVRVWQPWTVEPPPPSAMEFARAAAGEYAPRAESGIEPAGDRAVAATRDRESAFPLELVLVDARTRTPLPAFALVASDDTGASERLVSDEHGRVRGTRAFAPGELALRLVDEPRLAAWRERRLADRNLAWIVPWTHARADAPSELALEVGPTFALEFAGAVSADLEGLVCRLVASAPDAAVPESRAPVRNGPRGAWVRFASEARALAGPAPWRFEARTEFAVATAHVDSLDGGGRLELAFEPRGVLEVELVDEDGAPVAGRVDLSSAAAGDPAAPAWSAPGIARFSGLAPGAWSVLARELAHADAREEVEVLPGAARAVRIVLARRPSAGDVAGEVRIEARYDARIVVELAPRDTPELVRRVEVAADSVRTSSFPFAFRGLPDGEYVVRASAAGVHRWKENAVVVRPGTTDLVLSAEAAASSRPLVLRAFDAETGAPIAHFQARVDVDADAPGNRRVTRKSSILVGGVPLGAPVAWAVVAEGYVPALGDERAFEDEGDHGVVRARLARGFGRRVLVLDARGAPIAHARVTADPDLAAETDATGIAWLSGAAVPRALRIEVGASRVERDVRDLESDGLATWTVRLP